jgi:2,4-dienoyl-CoA reductase (NADPH2)
MEENDGRALDEGENDMLIEAYAAAAKRAVSAGFDAVQIHSARGYLCDQFISPYTNRKTDRWGGSSENRMRFLLEVFRHMRKTVGDDYPITVKLNSEDVIDGGLTIQDSTQIS